MSWLVCDTIGKRDSMALPWWPWRVSALRPYATSRHMRVGDEFVLRLAGPVAVTHGVAAVRALDLLQEHDVGREAVQPLAQLVDHHATGDLRETLVDVVGGDGEAHARS